MKRSYVIAVAATVVLVALVATRSGGSDSYRFAAVFDTARGMSEGQLIKVAGAKVGSVREVSLTKDRKARMVFDVDKRFGPFREGATCKILPEGFISENFVQCDPGPPGTAQLAEADGMPTVPVERTSASIQLQQVVDTFTLPVDQRIHVMLTEMGLATIGRGRDINAVLRRTNPALTEAQRVLELINAQRTDIQRAVEQTDSVLTEVRRRDQSLRRFVSSSAAVVKESARHRPGLSASIENLPPLLDETQSRLSALDEISRRLTPTVRTLRASAPGLTKLNSALPAFTRAGVPAVRSLGPLARTGTAAIAPTSAVVKRLSDFTAEFKRPALLIRQFLENLRDVGGFEQLFNAIYGLANHTAAFDEVSHFQSIIVNVQQQCVLQPDLPRCDHRFTAPNDGKNPISGTMSKPAPNTIDTLSEARRSPGGRQLRTLLDTLLSLRGK